MVKALESVTINHDWTDKRNLCLERKIDNNKKSFEGGDDEDEVDISSTSSITSTISGIGGDNDTNTQTPLGSLIGNDRGGGPLNTAGEYVKFNTYLLH